MSDIQKLYEQVSAASCRQEHDHWADSNRPY